MKSQPSKYDAKIVRPFLRAAEQTIRGSAEAGGGAVGFVSPLEPLFNGCTLTKTSFYFRNRGKPIS